MIFESVVQKINSWHNSKKENLHITGLNSAQFSFIINECEKDTEFIKKNNFVFICDSVDHAENLYECFKVSKISKKLLFYPGHDLSPYSGAMTSERALFERFKVLNFLANNNEETFILISTFESFSMRVPPRSFFKEYNFKIETSDIISPDELARKLVSLGYSSSPSIEEPGTFSSKGEIFDIYTIDSRPIRLLYFDDMIEEIIFIDLETQKSIRDKKLDKVSIAPTPQIFGTDEVFSHKLRENIPMPATAQKSRFAKRKEIFSSLSDNYLFDNYAAFTPLFFEKSEVLLDYLNDETIKVLFNEVEFSRSYSDFFEQLRVEFELEWQDLDNDNLLPEPIRLYDTNLENTLKNISHISIDDLSYANVLDEELRTSIELKVVPAIGYLSQDINPSLSRAEYTKAIFEFIKSKYKSSGEIYFSYEHDNSKNEFFHLMEVFEFDQSIQKRVFFTKSKLPNGFFYESEKILVLSEADIFSSKLRKTKATKKVSVDVFAEQLATLKKGDFVIHSEHGVGVYDGLESLDIGDSKSDYIVLIYKGNDKVYVPVYKMNLIQKHADGNATISTDSLRTNKFSNLKSKARNSAKKLAFDLLKLQAERQSSSGYSFSAPDQEYRDFEMAFPFQETPDQINAVNEVIESMQKPIAMDHLVCGDVGFGKTEVAMRAAFKAVLDKKQVCVLVPTTVLALQHYNSFVKRFSKFPVEIEFLSRFKTAKQTKEVIEKLKDGKIDILIGTHKLLSDKIKYQDLGLVIVDEEQRFGVAHKEKLKLLKANVDFLTLTATPIPRTLQLSFLGIREMSLIQTAPPRRQSIKSYLIKEDDLTLQTAIKKELNRGGQVFIVHNKVSDIDHFSNYIQELVPEAKIVYAHGQMSEKELEEKMNAFYSGTYQILISTTIIESGIDIPNANTMIIDRADNYGLAQLHQLRGRIGRSDKKAYAYFVIPKHKPISEIAQRRLKALQTYADMGSGFNIATCDLEIRGAGDILGAEQSGQIDNVGLELYMQLLKEAIQELRGEKKLIKQDVEVKTPFPSYIPANYIKDSSERLKQYKRLSNCDNLENLFNIKDEFVDVYGAIPIELENLFTTLEVRMSLMDASLKMIQVGGRLATLTFDKSYIEQNLELRNRMLDYFLSRPRSFQLTPDFKVIYTHKNELTQSEFLKFSKDLAEKILPC
ncbi:transcription-repair coupling factor [Halobacteriovorax marinus]|uniref:transcription-repair coupling factor n=1 Tax=Halobacteriovorax marinus TaxID=97084 RepID=UPI000BC3586F|nr:transcription-repair coupling factor [Halobacteriovorax marinus]ATH06402.1 transcription-repair coupling factor [Halobacteriovorax marinus]